MTQLLNNLLAAYNESLDNNRMSEEQARTEIQNKYNVSFVSWDIHTKRYSEIVNKPPFADIAYKGFVLKTNWNGEATCTTLYNAGNEVIFATFSTPLDTLSSIEKAKLKIG